MTKLARVGIAALALILAGCASMSGSTSSASSSGGMSSWEKSSPYSGRL